MPEKKIKISKGTPYPLGAHKINSGINFSVVLPDDGEALLCLVRKNGRGAVKKVSLLEEYRYGNIAAVFIEGIDIEKYNYYYEIDGQKVLDSYAAVVTGSKGFGHNPCRDGYVCGMVSDYDWKADVNPRLKPEEVILYRVNVRGFTKHRSSQTEGKGTFYGLMQKITYLKELGINQIELMPVYDFQDCFIIDETIRRVNYWGYSDNNYYYAVKEDYAYGKNAADELKDLVRTLHVNRMELILEFYFPKNIKVDFIRDCLRYWMLEYHVDGFHLTGDGISREVMKRLVEEPLFAKTKLYGPQPDFSYMNQQKNVPVFRNVAVCTDDYMQQMRSFLRGDMGKSREASYYLSRNAVYHSYINYMSSHDGFTMCDMVSYNKKHNEANGQDNLDGCNWNISWNCGEEGSSKKKQVLSLRRKQMKNAWLMLLCSQGVPAILMGDEWCNSQNGNNNVYCQDNEVGWMNWKLPKAYEGMHDYVKELITFRREHPILHSSHVMTFTDYKETGIPDLSFHGAEPWKMEYKDIDGHIGLLYCGAYEEAEPAETLFVAFNMNRHSQKFALPKLPDNKNWQLVITTTEEGNAYLEDENTVLFLEERASAVLVSVEKRNEKE